MIYQLPPSKHHIVRELFSTLSKYQPMCTSVVENAYPGKIFVDDLDHPRTALLVTYIESESGGNWGFLAGDPTNEPFNQTLNKAVFDRQVIHKECPILFMTCDPEDWGGQLDTVFSPLPPIWTPRYHFVSQKLEYDWRGALPNGFVVEPIDENLLRFQGIEIPPDVSDTLTKWQSAKQNHPGFGDYGFVTMDKTSDVPVISSWATVDFVAKGMGDLGFFTQSDFRRKGLGTIAAAAAIEYGLNDGLNQINWTCDAENVGSYSTAGKLKLEKVENYKMAILIMNEENHMKFYKQRMV